MNSLSLITKVYYLDVIQGSPLLGKCLPDSPDLSIGPVSREIRYGELFRHHQFRVFHSGC
jgi:hypothetical protein